MNQTGNPSRRVVKDAMNRAVKDAMDTAATHSLAASGGPFKVGVIIDFADWPVGYIDWENIAAKLAQRVDWKLATPDTPVMTIHSGTVLNRSYGLAKFGRPEVECIAFGCSQRALQQDVLDSLLAILRQEPVVAVEVIEEDVREAPFSLMDVGFLTPRCLVRLGDGGDGPNVHETSGGFPVAYLTSTDDAGIIEIVDAPDGLAILERNLTQLGLHWVAPA